MSIVSFNHNLLGAFSGVQVSQQVTQFRSIVYATYPERFRQSTVKTSYGDDERNFTEHGYVCPQVEPMDYSSTGGMIPGETPFRADEHKCLGLTITVPNSALEQQGSNSTTADEASKGLPVLIYIHGGAFERGNGAMGGGHEQKHNVETSVNDETPVIAVTLQYRLNWFGMIGSQDLIDEAKANNEAPLNYGFFDQRNALRWVQRYIAGFGGDPDNVTLHGESAGGVCVYYHILGTEKLFKRAIVVSGGAETAVPSPLDPKQRGYDRLLATLNITSSNPSERLAALRIAPVSAFISALSLSAAANGWAAYNDPTFFAKPVTYGNAAELASKVSWVEEIMTGNCGFEGYFYYDLAKSRSPAALYGSLSQAFSQEKVAKLLTAYGITIGMDQNTWWTKSMEFFGDFFLGETNHQLAIVASAKKPVYRYWFDVGNPFPGSIRYQVAHHAVDMYYAFQTLQFRFPSQRDVGIATQFARYLIGFANGKEPWKRFEVSGDQEVHIANWERGWITRTRDEDEKIKERRYKAMEVMREVLGEKYGDTYLDIGKLLGS